MARLKNHLPSALGALFFLVTIYFSLNKNMNSLKYISLKWMLIDKY